MLDNLLRFHEFLKFRGDDCFVLDYGHSPVPFKTLCSIYGNMYFVALESNQKLKIFYFRGTRDAFEERCELLLHTISEGYYNITMKCPGLRLWLLGYVPALLTADFSDNELADAIRIDFFKHGHKAYDTGENLLGNVCNKNLVSFNCIAFNESRFLDFDFTRWLMRERKKILKEFKRQTRNL